MKNGVKLIVTKEYDFITSIPISDAVCQVYKITVRVQRGVPRRYGLGIPSRLP